MCVTAGRKAERQGKPDKGVAEEIFGGPLPLSGPKKRKCLLPDGMPVRCTVMEDETPTAPKTPRVPHAAHGVDVNFCRTPKCANFGVPIPQEAEKGCGAANPYKIIANGRKVPAAPCCATTATRPSLTSPAWPVGLGPPPSGGTACRSGYGSIWPGTTGTPGLMRFSIFMRRRINAKVVDIK